MSPEPSDPELRIQNSERTMAQPLAYDLPPAPPGEQAFTAADDLARLLETLHTSGTLRVLNGLVSQFQEVMAVVLDGLNTDEGRNGLANLLVLAKLLGRIDADGLDRFVAALDRALADAGSDLGAKSRFIEAVSAQPRRPETRREYGRFLLGQGRLDRAEPELGEAARLDPWDAETRLLLGIVQTMNGLDPADDWREAVRLDPDLVGPLSAGVRVGETVVPLWTAPTVFGWPRADAVPPGSDAGVYSSSGTPLARGRWPGVARDLGAGLYVVQAGGAVRRVAVVRDGT